MLTVAIGIYAYPHFYPINNRIVRVHLSFLKNEG